MRGLIILCGIISCGIISCGILASCVLALGVQAAAALPLSEFGRVYPYLVRKAQICLLTASRPKLTRSGMRHCSAEMRRQLPDTFAWAGAVTTLRAIGALTLPQDLPIAGRARALLVFRGWACRTRGRSEEIR